MRLSVAVDLEAMPVKTVVQLSAIEHQLSASIHFGPRRGPDPLPVRNNRATALASGRGIAQHLGKHIPILKGLESARQDLTFSRPADSASLYRAGLEFGWAGVVKPHLCGKNSVGATSAGSPLQREERADHCNGGALSLADSSKLGPLPSSCIPQRREIPSPMVWTGERCPYTVEGSKN